jgi:hypothetical protein
VVEPTEQELIAVGRALHAFVTRQFVASVQVLAREAETALTLLPSDKAVHEVATGEASPEEFATCLGGVRRALNAIKELCANGRVEVSRG